MTLLIEEMTRIFFLIALTHYSLIIAIVENDGSNFFLYFNILPSVLGLENDSAGLSYLFFNPELFVWALLGFS